MKSDSAIVYDSSAENTEQRLARAADHLEEVLEAVDLERDRELAEAVLAAVEATDRAYSLQNDRGDKRRQLAKEIEALSRVE